MSSKKTTSPRGSSSLRVIAAALAVVYVVWNLCWLWQGQTAPALFLSLTGLPAPTTGGTRAMRSLINGEILQSLRFNAMALPMTLVFFGTLAVLLWQTVKRRRLQLPAWLIPLWLTLMAAAWLSKILLPIIL